MLFSSRDSRPTIERRTADASTAPPVDLAVPEGLSTATFGVG